MPDIMSFWLVGWVLVTTDRNVSLDPVEALLTPSPHCLSLWVVLALLTYTIQTEGRVYVVWDAIPGVSDKLGEARVHFLLLLIVPEEKHKIQIFL